MAWKACQSLVFDHGGALPKILFPLTLNLNVHFVALLLLLIRFVGRFSMPSRASTLPLGLIFAFAATAQAQCQPENPLGGAFKNPPECNVVGTSDYENNVIWALNTVQTLSWTTTFTEDAFYNLTLWQENPSEFGAAVSNTPIYSTKKFPPSSLSNFLGLTESAQSTTSARAPWSP